MKLSCFRRPPAEADMPVSASHGFQGLLKYGSPIFCVLRPSLTGKKDRPTAGLSRSPSQGFLHQKSEASRLRFIDLQSSVFSF